MGTPSILERSGLGDAKLLESAGVPVVAPLPGVGSEHQDHQMVMVTYKADLGPWENVDSVFNGVLNTTELIRDNEAILSWKGVDASAKVRPTQAEIDMFKPALRKWWDEHFAHEPSRPLGIIVVYAGLVIHATITRCMTRANEGFSVMSVTTAYPTDDRYFTMAAYNPYPRSRGHVHITGPGIDDPLDLRTGILSDPEETDIQVLVWLYKKQRQVAKRMGCQRGQISPGPAFPANSSISSDPTKDPSREDDPTFSPDDDTAIEQWIRETVATPFHSLGTCKMAAESEFGVVDNSLNVYRVKGLKIADLSIAPGNVAGNTMNAAVVIGEKAADITIGEF
ncbi:alcohol oxidase [Metarhizium guizhouense ARSEF 977]|uniref:Alcohol oxidase n=1 Tax=Metarhizium guizhouense (strain ARSEF 977) TaxID=1276136 RepID=A0A0B4GUF6_METGA|nr:alcohol oxidase [Metarhizium guizhouense ARSEF 977]